MHRRDYADNRQQQRLRSGGSIVISRCNSHVWSQGGREVVHIGCRWGGGRRKYFQVIVYRGFVGGKWRVRVMNDVFCRCSAADVAISQSEGDTGCCSRWWVILGQHLVYFARFSQVDWIVLCVSDSTSVYLFVPTSSHACRSFSRIKDFLNYPAFAPPVDGAASADSEELEVLVGGRLRSAASSEWAESPPQEFWSWMLFVL
jgi:hypothetical protein